MNATMEMQAPEMLTAPNGHFTTKSVGDTIFHGPLENLPYPAANDLESRIERMSTDGYVWFPGVLNAEEVAELRARMDAMGGPDEEYVVKGWCFNKHIVSDFTQNPDHLDYIDRPGVIEVAEAILDPGCHVTGGTSWITGQGRTMGVHVDYQPIRLPEAVHDNPNVKVPIFTCTAHFYLNDMVAELGPTTLVPGSHRAGRPPVNECAWHGVTPKAAMVKAGDVVLFRGDLWHGAWKNSGPHHRYMLQVHYANGQMAKGYPAMQYESLYAPAVLDKTTDRQRRLLGAK